MMDSYVFDNEFFEMMPPWADEISICKFTNYMTK